MDVDGEKTTQPNAPRVRVPHPLQTVVGLGNPGARYAGTRHNLGFRVVDLLAGEKNGRWMQASTYLFSEVFSQSCPLLLVKPTTYMNGSGEAVEELLHCRNLVLGDVLVVVDDVNLEPGSLRFRRKGSHGGHNGLRSIIETVGASDFPRLRMGIGMPPPEVPLIDYVLGAFEPGEMEMVEKQVRTAVAGVTCWTAQGLDIAMNLFNQ